MPIRITASIDGFRRAGMAHPAEPRLYPDGYFSDEQLDQLRAEPRLAVESVAEAETDPTDPAPGALDENDSSGDLTGHLDGVADAEGNVTQLEDMKVSDLRDIAKNMDIDGASNLKKAELIEAIRATEVSVSDDEA